MKIFFTTLFILAPVVASASQIVPKYLGANYVAIGNNGRSWTYGSGNSQSQAERQVQYSCPSCIWASGSGCCATAISGSYGRQVDYGVSCAGTVSEAAHSARKACESERGLECSTVGAVCARR